MFNFIKKRWQTFRNWPTSNDSSQINKAVCDDDAVPTITGTANPESNEQRLERLCQWCIDGQALAAELELHNWQLEQNCPADAVVLLASRLAQRQQYDAALKLLHNFIEHDDTNTSYRFRASAIAQPTNINQLIATIHWLINETKTAPLTISRNDEAIDTLDAIANPNAQPPHCRADIESLAGDLIEHPELIPPLVAAQKIEKHQNTIALLRASITRVAQDIDHKSTYVATCVAAAQLALLASDTDDARRWAHRGLRQAPFNASIAIILGQIEDDQTLGPTASSVLLGAVNRFPRYPDLRAALIRREFAEGQTAVAKRRLAQWLQREPNQPMATELEQELELAA